MVETKELQPINLENTSWLTNIDNEFQALVGLGLVWRSV